MDNSTDSSIAQIGNNFRADAHAAIDKVADKVPPAAERVAKSAHSGVNQVADAVETASGRLAARGKQVSASCKALAESGRGRVRANPAISVLLAAAAGYGISRLLSSRSGK